MVDNTAPTNRVAAELTSEVVAAEEVLVVVFVVNVAVESVEPPVVEPLEESGLVPTE